MNGHLPAELKVRENTARVQESYPRTKKKEVQGVVVPLKQDVRDAYPKDVLEFKFCSSPLIAT